MTKTTTKKNGLRTPAAYVSRFRRRQSHSGMKRLDVSVKAKDAGLVKTIASTLRADGPEAERLRQKLQIELFPAQAKTGADFMALMRKLPHPGMDLILKRDNIERPVFSFE